MQHYRRLRSALSRKFPEGALIHVEGGKPTPRNFDVDYVFRQNSDFLYLTGVEEPGCHLLLDPKRGTETLLLPRIDNHHRVWEGEVPSPAQARKLYGVDRVDYSDTIERQLARRRVVSKAKLREALDELRACKVVEELALMKNANRISAHGHRAVMQAARPGMREYQLQAVFEVECLSRGLRHLAYPSIVATGVNGATLHYRRNDSRLRAGDLLLIDAGAEDRGYAADITRTFPVNGKFTRRQRDVYSIVLETQKTCIQSSSVGVVSATLHVQSMRMIAEGLKSLGLLRGDVDGLVENGAVRLFYPHGLTHMLGLDVHDTTGGRLRRVANPTNIPVRFIAKLEAGFVITMEPGIYFIAALLNDPALREKHRQSVNFAKAETFLDFGGVRIEDDIVIRAHGSPLNLTRVPKEIHDVENACAEDSARR